MSDETWPVSPEDVWRAEILQFRYGVISRIVQMDHSRVSQTQAVKEAATQQWHHPTKGMIRISERTIWYWVKRYRRRGPAGLVPKARKDKGTLKAFSAEMLDKIIAVRDDNHKRSTPKILEILRLQGHDTEELKISTINRQMDKLGKSRMILKATSQTVREPIITKAPNELWVGDFKHGPLARHPKTNEIVPTRFSGFIDHYSRLVPFGAYYLQENLPVLEDSYKRGVGRKGVPTKTYVDNGLVYHSDLFELACIRLDTILIHSTPHDPATRGMIERFNRTLNEGFESEVKALKEILPLNELNEFFWAWLEESYHRTPNETTGQPPLERFHAEGFTPRYADPQELDEAFRIPAMRKVDPRYSTVSISGIEYMVEPRLRKREVTVLYDPFDASSVIIFYKGERIQRAVPRQANEEREKPIEVSQKDPEINYLEMIRAAYLRRLRQDAVSTAFRDLPPGPFGFTGFVRLFERVLGMELDQKGRERLEAFWKTFGPLKESEVRTVLERCLARREEGKHVEHYLDRIRQYTNRRRNRNNTKEGTS
jgi:transposase InsO family protein